MCIGDQILHALLGTPPDGRELYRYRVDDTQYQRARQYLRRRLEEVVLGELDSAECAVFCVFGAEWWRREHLSGPWSWDGILSAIGSGGAPHDQIARAVTRGLQLLRRPLLRTAQGRQYLVTLACEGGLPLARLREHQGPLRRHFRAVLEHFQTMGMTGEDEPEELAKVAQLHDHHLQASLRHPVVHRLVGSLVGAVWRLRSRLDRLDGDVLARLDQRHPTWRDELPLLLDNETAVSLVRGLVLEASIVERRASGGLRIVTRIEAFDQQPRLVRHLECPDVIQQGEFEAAFGRWFSEASSVSLRIRAADADQPAARVTPGGDSTWFVQVRPVEITGQAAEQELEAVAAVRGQADVLRGPITGGEALGPLPWVFRQEEGHWSLVATGSVSRREDVLLVALPPDHEITGDVEALDKPLRSRSLHLVRGTAEVKVDAGTIRIRTGSVSDASGTLVLVGDRFGHMSGDRTVWRGLPRLVRRTGLREDEVPLEVKVSSGWRGARDTDVGQLEVRALDDDLVVFRRRLRVVPHDLEIELAIGDGTQRPGRITLRSQRLTDAGAPSDRRYSVHVRRRPAQIELEVHAQDHQPPSHLPVRLMFGSVPFDGTLVFPVRTLRFETPDSVPIPPGLRLHVARLGGYRAVALSPRHGARFFVHLQVQDAPAPVPWPRILELQREPSGEHALDLRDVQGVALEMLDATETIDATVRIRLEEIGANVIAPTLVVRRYDWTLRRDETLGDVILEGASDDEVPDITVEVRPFHQIDAVDVLPRLRSPLRTEPRWVFQPDERAAGSWLVTARHGPWQRCRPTVYSGRLGELHDQGDLRAAVHVANATERMTAIRVALDEMAGHWDHPDWPMVDAHVDLLDDLPAATFDLVRALARNPRAMALLAVRIAPQPYSLVRLIENIEQLAFLWEAVGIGSWMAAFDALAANFEDVSLAANEVDARARQLGRHLYAPLVARDCWRADRGLGPAHHKEELELTARQVLFPNCMSELVSLRDQAIAELLLEHADSDAWPAPEQPLSLPGLGSYGPRRIPDPPRHTTVEAPIRLAIAAATNALPDVHTLVFLEEVRSFAPSWFELAFRTTLTAVVAHRRGTR